MPTEKEYALDSFLRYNVGGYYGPPVLRCSDNLVCSEHIVVNDDYEEEDE